MRLHQSPAHTVVKALTRLDGYDVDVPWPPLCGHHMLESGISGRLHPSISETSQQQGPNDGYLNQVILGVRTLTNAANVVKRVTIRGLVPTLAKTVLSSSNFLVKRLTEVPTSRDLKNQLKRSNSPVIGRTLWLAIAFWVR